ncbi:hypothetical protein O1611_g4567 [Lasiodiplodia mahajangana]|uniref:Uncharacterized protein n=1 Tax=Lasiodiplodia mahajangana TaxID=1108764 RepID=A0ACC2JNH8_9PEZI|nr:hypothetical protein O1611_g4567 [Lasiodiplodia mahajangana]
MLVGSSRLPAEAAAGGLLNLAQVISNSGHDDMIHDAVLDYYGRRLATCSTDKTIKIFEIEGESQRLIETLKGHEGALATTGRYSSGASKRTNGNDSTTSPYTRPL